MEEEPGRVELNPRIGQDPLKPLKLRNGPSELVALLSVLDGTLERYPEALIVMVGMQAPPNMGADYCQGFREVFPLVAARNGCPRRLRGNSRAALRNQPDEHRAPGQRFEKS